MIPWWLKVQVRTVFNFFSTVASRTCEYKLQCDVNCVKILSTFSQQIQCKSCFWASPLLKHKVSLHLSFRQQDLSGKCPIMSGEVTWPLPTNKRPVFSLTDQWKPRMMSGVFSLVYRWHFHIQRKQIIGEKVRWRGHNYSSDLHRFPT